MIIEYFRLALTNLSHSKTRSYLTMIGIFIGIASVVSLISLGEGLKATVNEQFSSIGTDKILIQPSSAGFGPPGSYSASEITTRDLKEVSQVTGVKETTGRILQPAKIVFHNKATFNFAGSLPQDDTRRLVIESGNFKMESGRMLEPSDTFKVVIGNDYATKDIFDRPLQVGDKIEINGFNFEVAGILKRLGTAEGRDRSVIINEDVLRQIFNKSDSYDMIVAQVNNPDEVESVVASIERSLRRSRNVEKGKEDFQVQSSVSFIATLNSILSMVQTVLVGIAGISLLVGGIGIMNTMYTSVLERTKEIGIMKAIGAKNEDILGIFLVESGMLGMVGGIIGIMLGMGLAKLVEIAASSALGSSYLKAEFSWILIVGALTFSFVVGSISGLLPALQAANLKPVDALRYE